MDVFYAYTYGSAAWLATQAVPLLVAPKLIVAFLAHEAHSTTGNTTSTSASVRASDYLCRP